MTIFRATWIIQNTKSNKTISFRENLIKILSIGGFLASDLIKQLLPWIVANRRHASSNCPQNRPLMFEFLRNVFQSFCLKFRDFTQILFCWIIIQNEILCTLVKHSQSDERFKIMLSSEIIQHCFKSQFLNDLRLRTKSQSNYEKQKHFN